MSTPALSEDEFSDRELGSTGKLTSRSGLEDSVEVAGVGASSEVDGEQTRISSGVRPVKNEGDDDDILVAQPPKEREGSDYHAVAISGTTALDVLDQLVASKTIGKERAARLRRKYKTLQETLESSRQLESSLLDKVKLLGQQLNYQKKVLDKGAAFPEGDSSESTNLRQNQMVHQNELDMSNARLEVLQERIDQLELEHSALEKEYGRLPKKEELDQHIKDLGKTVEELKEEIDRRSEDVGHCQHELDKRNNRIAGINQETDEMCQVKEMLQQELINLRNGPNIGKEIEACKKKKSTTTDEISEMEAQSLELTGMLREAEARNDSLKEKCKQTSSELKEQKSLLVENEIGLDRWNKDLMMMKEREASQLEDKATLEMRQKHRQVEYKSLFMAQASKVKEKDRELKALKKAELQLNMLKESKQQVSNKMDKLEEKKKELQEDYDRLVAAKEEVVKDVAGLRKGMKMRIGMTEADQVRLDNLLLVEAQTKKMAVELQEKAKDLSKDVTATIKSRDRETNVYYRAVREHANIRDDLLTKQILISDQQKKTQQMNKELKDSAAAYAIVKAERNKAHSQIYLMQQVLAEFSEKSKILANETEILRNALSEKDKLVQKNTALFTAKMNERDSLRQELNKLKCSQSDLTVDLDQQRAIISRLVHQVTETEEDLTRLRKQYQKSVQDRNDLGLQLIERNEEVSVFYEKVNTQEAVIKQATLQLEMREEELRMLNLELNRLKDDIYVFRKSLPNKEKLEYELEESTMELKQCEEHMRQLEKAVEDPSNPERVNFLQGQDPSRDQLDVKLNKVQVQYSACARQCLEKEFVLEQVSKLTDRASKRAESRRSSTLAVAKKVNHYQSKIKETTRKMMALVSELSMQQALSLRLAQEVSELDSRVKKATVRLENGEIPDEEMHAEWERYVQTERQRMEAQLEKELEMETQPRVLSGGTVTTAELRPNAYIPTDTEDLPLPRPYGKCAPFKPTLPGGAMRHIRKPEPKPIDI